MKTKQLQNKIKKLEQQVEQLQTKPFPWLACFGSVIGGLLCYLWYFVLVESWNVLQVGQCLNENVCTASQFLFVAGTIVGYVLVAVTVISVVALLKGGYGKLKSYNEFGLIILLLFGLTVYPILSLIISLIRSLMIVGLIGHIISSLLVGMTISITVCIICSIIIGLMEEFRD